MLDTAQSPEASRTLLISAVAPSTKPLSQIGVVSPASPDEELLAVAVVELELLMHHPYHPSMSTGRSTKSCLLPSSRCSK